MKNIIFCGYRDWSIKILEDIEEYLGKKIEHVVDQEKLSSIDKEAENLIILAGWSWYVPEDIINSNIVVGLHPSDLPDYAGGSPIQNQILEGIINTKMTLFQLNTQFDRGDVISKTDLCLDGNMTDIFHNLRTAGTQLLKDFIDKFPNYTRQKQEINKMHVRRLKPADSVISSEKMSSMTAREIYDFIRCREDPYPNVFFEDHTGKVFFKKVHFEPKKS